jgi:hypothetical protein
MASAGFPLQRPVLEEPLFFHLQEGSDSLAKAGLALMELVNQVADPHFAQSPAFVYLWQQFTAFGPVLLSVLSPVPRPILWTPSDIFSHVGQQI